MLKYLLDTNMLLTNNVKEFERVPGIVLENWREA